MTAVTQGDWSTRPSTASAAPGGARGLPRPLPSVAPELMAIYRPRAAELSARISSTICQEVAGFSTPAMAAAVHEAISAAVNVFIDALSGAPVRGREIAEHFRRLGSLKGRAGHDLDAMNAAHHVAIREARREIRRAGQEFGLGTDVVNALSTAVMDYQGDLHQQSMAGWVKGRSQRRRVCDDARDRLLSTMLSNASRDKIHEVAASCWQVPGIVAVATTVADQPTVAAADALTNGPWSIGGVRNGRLVLVTSEDLIEQVAAMLAQHSATPVAISWGVAPEETRHGLRWATRGLGLVRQGIIAAPPDRIVRCHDHRADLMLHADPALSRAVALDVLAPLLAEKPHQRTELWETMLLWLQTHASAPVLGRELGVHDQTVRHRLRRLKSMFGPALDDPARSAQILQALQTLRATHAVPDRPSK